LPGRNIRVKQNGSFPGDGWGDGVKNSFVDRMKDTVSRWNAAYNNMGSASDVVWVGVNDEWDIVAQIGSPTGAYLGVTFIDGGQGCFVHDTTGNSTFSTAIYITSQTWWFTQDDTRRGYWETECPTQNPPTYTCTKLYDFGSTFAHELGHAAGVILHPNDVDRQTASGSVAAAECERLDAQGRPLWRATMCPTYFGENGLPLPNQRWRSERRTLHIWDTDSLRAIHDSF